MKTDELVTRLARELGIPEDELHADKLEKAGLLGNSMSVAAANLLIAAALGEGGIVKRVQNWSQMLIGEHDLSNTPEKGMKIPTNVEHGVEWSGLLTARFSDILACIIGVTRDGGVPFYTDGAPDNIQAVTISRSRPMAILEFVSGDGDSQFISTMIFADKPEDGSKRSTEIPEYIPGMETTCTIHGDVIRNIAKALGPTTAQDSVLNRPEETTCKIA